MKILLINAASVNEPLKKQAPFMPLALPLLAASAPSHEYTFVDGLWDEEPDFKAAWELVGISVRLTAEIRAYEIAERFRERGIPVVLGGPQVSAVPQRAIKHADAVVVGEGESVWPVLLEDLAGGRLRDFYVCIPGEFELPEGRTMFKTDTLVSLGSTFPRANRSFYRHKYRFDTVFATRGCPIGCDFCAVPSMFGKKFRHRPISEVVAEIDQFRAYYYLLDDTVFGKPSTYDYYLELYDAIAHLEKRRYWVGQANLDAAATEKGREVIKKAVEAGLVYTMVGMESVHPETLRKNGAIAKMGVKGSDDPLAAIKQNIRYLQDLGLIVSGWFVVGYDDDTIDTYRATLDFCHEMDVIPVIAPVKALPGTRLYQRVKAEGRLDDTKFINVRHPNIKDEDVAAVREVINREAYTVNRTWKRTMRVWRALEGKHPEERIYKSIFAYILQRKLRKGILTEEVFDGLVEELDAKQRAGRAGTSGR